MVSVLLRMLPLTDPSFACLLSGVLILFVFSEGMLALCSLDSQNQAYIVHVTSTIIVDG